MRRRACLTVAGGTVTTILAGCVGDDSDGNSTPENGESGEQENGNSDDNTPENGMDNRDEETPENGMDNGDEETPENGMDNGDEETPENGMDNGDEETPENGEETVEADQEVAVRGTNAFEPNLTEIEVGDTLKWVGDGGSHTVTFYHEDNDRQHRTPRGVEAIDEPIGDGEDVVFIFNEAGVYDYYCSPHESTGMVGSVIVGETDDAEQPGLQEPGDGIPDAAASAISDLNFDARDTLGMEQPPWVEIVEPAGTFPTESEFQLVFETNLEPGTGMRVSLQSESGEGAPFFKQFPAAKVNENQRIIITVDFTQYSSGTAGIITVRTAGGTQTLLEEEFQLE